MPRRSRSARSSAGNRPPSGTAAGAPTPASPRPGSGPRTGLAEIRIPDLQPGSSIMPGKVNPVVPEAVCQVVAQIIGNDAAVAFGGAAGNLELNVMLPVIARNLLESIRLLASVSRLFADRCVDGITADADRCRELAE